MTSSGRGDSIAHVLRVLARNGATHRAEPEPDPAQWNRWATGMAEDIVGDRGREEADMNDRLYWVWNLNGDHRAAAFTAEGAEDALVQYLEQGSFADDETFYVVKDEFVREFGFKNERILEERRRSDVAPLREVTGG